MQRSIKMLGAAALLATALSAGVVASAQTAASAPATSGSGTPTSSSSSTATTTPRDDGQGFANLEDRRFNHLTKALDLNSEQQSKLKTILDDAESQRKSLHDSKGTSRADRRAQMKSIQQSTHSAISAMLTSDQSQKFEEMTTRAQEGLAGRVARHKGSQTDSGTGSADTSSSGTPSASGTGDAGDTDSDE